MSESIWKKEISFSRKPKAPTEPAAAKPPKEPKPKRVKKAKGEQAPKPASTSFWKKEISLGKKSPKAPTLAEIVADEPRELQEQREAVWEHEVGGPTPQKQPIWKREISLSRKKPADDEVARLVELATKTVDPSFAPVAAEPVEHPTDVAEAVVAAEPVVDTHPVEMLPVDAPVVPEPAPVAPVSVEPLAVAPEPEPVVVPPLPVAVPPVPVAVAPAPEPLAPVALHVEAAPVEEWMEPHAVEPEPWLAEPELPPVPEAEAIVVHPPVPAAELPPLPAAKVPFWKKELSLGKKKSKPVAAPAEVPVVQGGVHPPVPAAELPPLAAAKVPFWKKELSLGKKQSAPKVKRGFSLPSVSLPSLSRGGGGHQVKRLVGLKVGGSQLAAARIANNGAAELLQVCRRDLEPGIVVAGELRDPDALARSLKEFFAANKLPRKNVRLGIASNRIGVRTFEIAGIEDNKQLENAIHFRAQETLPIPLDEAVLDYRILEEKVDDEGTPTKRVLLVVAYKELVDRYISACKKAGITLSGIDLEAFALLRALSAPRAEDAPSDSALVAVAIGHDRSTFAVSDGRVCEFTRVLEWGGWSLNVALARVFDSTPSEVEAIKRSLTLDGTTTPAGLTEEQTAHALDAVRRQVQSFARELVSSLQFYQNQPGSLGIGEIVLTGGTTGMPGLAEELERLIGVHVRVGDPLARVKVAKHGADTDQIGSLAVAIGLGIED
jgi:type IV pilus assembly protein PilM